MFRCPVLLIASVLVSFCSSGSVAREAAPVSIGDLINKLSELRASAEIEESPCIVRVLDEVLVRCRAVDALEDDSVGECASDGFSDVQFRIFIGCDLEHLNKLISETMMPSPATGKWLDIYSSWRDWLQSYHSTLVDQLIQPASGLMSSLSVEGAPAAEIKRVEEIWMLAGRLRNADMQAVYDAGLWEGTFAELTRLLNDRPQEEAFRTDATRDLWSRLEKAVRRFGGETEFARACANSAVLQKTSPERQDETNRPPVGMLERVDAEEISGWAYDPDYPEQVLSVLVLVNDKIAGVTVANKRSEMVRASESLAHRNHGFIFTDFTLNKGENVIQVFALDYNDGSRRAIGARRVEVP